MGLPPVAGAVYTGNAMKTNSWSSLPAVLTLPHARVSNFCLYNGINGSFEQRAIVRGNSFRPFTVDGTAVTGKSERLSGIIP